MPGIFCADFATATGFCDFALKRTEYITKWSSDFHG